MLQILGGQDTAKLRQMMFEFDSTQHKTRQGETILNFLKLPADMLFRIEDYFSKPDIKRIRQNFQRHQTVLANCISQFVDFVTANEYVLVADLIETVVPCTTHELFVLKKDYRVVEGV